jgi:ATPase subunit of ABC transporter with duplicated ATPase domains
VGYLAQEPVLDETKTVRENVIEGIESFKKELFWAYHQACLDLNAAVSEEEKSKLQATHQRLQAEMEKYKLLDLERKVAIAMASLRCPPPNASISNLSGVVMYSFHSEW